MITTAITCDGCGQPINPDHDNWLTINHKRPYYHSNMRYEFHAHNNIQCATSALKRDNR